MTIRIPKDFEAVVFTPPSRVDHDLVSSLMNAVDNAGLPGVRGHRILHMQQVEHIDSAAIVGLMRIAEIAASHGTQFIACDPPPIVRSYLEIYGASYLLEGNVLSAGEDGSYVCDRLSFIPPFVPSAKPRFDVYRDGRVNSFELDRHGLREVAPVDFNRRVTRAKGRATQMVIAAKSGDLKELSAQGYVLIRRHACGCDATHSAFAQLHTLHDWYRRKGFDFVGIELLASDEPAGVVTERMTFRDRLHLDQFKALLKVDQAWKRLPAPVAEVHEETHYLYT
jgi:anti-anti-sigma regulatory factor